MLPAWKETGGAVRDAFTRGLSRTATAKDQLHLAELLLRASFYEEFKRHVNEQGSARPPHGSGARWKSFAIYIELRDKLLSEAACSQHWLHGIRKTSHDWFGRDPLEPAAHE